jgi:hypothetical protein
VTILERIYNGIYFLHTIAYIDYYDAILCNYRQGDKTMKHTRIHSFYDFRAYEGVDIDLRISLREYGIAWRKISDTEYKFIFGIVVSDDEFRNPIYTEFDYSCISKVDYDSMICEPWFCRKELEEFADCDMSVYNPINIYSAIQYHGVENILGISYNSFQIGKI